MAASRLNMIQAFIKAVKSETPLEAITNLHLICFVLLSALGPLPMLSSALEIYRCTMSAITFVGTKSLSDIEVPTVMDTLIVPSHPHAHGEVHTMASLRRRIWLPWLVANLGAGIETLADVLLVAPDYFHQPRLPSEQAVINYLQDGQILLYNVEDYLRLMDAAVTPVVTPTVPSTTPGTPPLWGE